MKELNIYSLHDFPKAKAFWTLFILFICGFFLTVFFTSILAQAFDFDELSTIKCSVILQNILTFIVPSILTAAILIRHPFRFLNLNAPKVRTDMIWLILIYIAATPVINWLTAINEAISLPESMSAIEQWMKESEAAAQAITDKLIDIDTIPQLLLATLYIGVLTGIGEELFFRGALQNLLMKCIRNKHLTVWITAVVFSAFHLQFYGFIPRTILGAILGYSLVWSGSLWVPIIIHAVNNSSVVIFTYLTRQGIVTDDISTLGANQEGFPIIATVSIVATLILIAAYRYTALKRRQNADY